MSTLPCFALCPSLLSSIIIIDKHRKYYTKAIEQRKWNKGNHYISSYISSCSSLSSSKVPQHVVSKVGVSSSVRTLLSLVFAHLAVLMLVAEMKVDKALVPEGVCRMVSRLRHVFWWSLRSCQSSVLWDQNSGQQSSKCLGVWGRCKGQL